MAISGFGINEEQSTTHDKSKKKGKVESKEIATPLDFFLRSRTNIYVYSVDRIMKVLHVLRQRS